MLPIIRKAAQLSGGPKALAEALGVTRQTLYLWQKVPADHIVEIEKATGGLIKRTELRPDLYEPAGADGKGASEIAQKGGA